LQQIYSTGTPRVIHIFGSDGSLILRSFLLRFLMLILYLWITRATPNPHAEPASARATVRYSTVTPVEPPLVETMLVRLSCLSPCLLV
jgi:hypothetical protein